MSDRLEFLTRLTAARRAHLSPTDLRPRTQAFLQRALALLFPHFAEGRDCTPETVAKDLDETTSALEDLLGSVGGEASAVAAFGAALPTVWQSSREDAEALFHGDPAAGSIDEVILAYPGFYATVCHRVAHVLHAAAVPVLPRLIAELARERTGVDIHPGASIGRRFMIDHGCGVVIGETAVIGNGVMLYQGVTIGALTVEKRKAGSKRHPTLEDRVVVYANATILGGETVIGHDSVVSGNAFVTKSVPAFSLVDRRSDARPRTDNGDLIVDFSI